MKELLLLLLAVPLLTGGCITHHVVAKHAMTHEESTVVEGEHPEDCPWLPKWKTETVPGQPAYYALVPLTVAGDIVASPIYLLAGVYVLLFERHP